MIISRKRRYVFAHAPKTGGTSLALALERRAAKDDILIGDTPKAIKRQGRVKNLRGSGRLWKHSGLSDIHGIVDDQEMADFFVVMMVRNPWDRLVSYYHWLRLQNFDHPAVAKARDMGFADFLRDAGIQRSFRAAPYASYVTDAHGVEQCDLYIRLEHLEADLSCFEAHLGFDLMPLEHVNSSERAVGYRDYYGDGDADLVAEFCTADIARFGYAF